jgi:arsenite methyltransferase
MNKAESRTEDAKKGGRGMSGQQSGRERADYGIDGPNAVRNTAVVSVMSLALGAVLYGKLRPLRPVLATVVLNLGVCSSLVGLVLVSGMVWSSKVGKLRARDHLIESLALRGDESVLDVGCGRGLLLIAAAKRLTTGKAVGVDIWSAKDQSGNRPEATLENARIELVAERVEVKDGDARLLPFKDGTFDVVVSSLVLHNIHDSDERRQAVREMVRVLKEDGRVAVLDALHTGEYANVLRESGMVDVERTEPRFLFFCPSRIVWGRKPCTLRSD